MTIHELLECSPEQLEAMTDDEIRNHFKFCEHITRPEIAKLHKPASNNGYSTPTVRPINAQTKAGINKLAELGIDVGYLMSPTKRRR